jgi:hypothetical protein
MSERKIASFVLSKNSFVQPPSSSLAAKKDVDQPKSSVDWGNVLYLLLYPGNPYSWFFYAFTFIFLYGTFSGN